jgi:hypothetical protein
MVSFNMIQAVSVSAFFLQCLDAAILDATIKKRCIHLSLGAGSVHNTLDFHLLPVFYALLNKTLDP